MSDKLSNVVHVTSLAKPTTTSLVSARHEVQRNQDARAAFTRARAEGWKSEQLAQVLVLILEPALEAPITEVEQAARYLADEYLQVGDGMLIVSTVTGRAIAKITEEDIWTPPPVARSDGRMVESQPRLRPDLAGFLVEWSFNEQRDVQLDAKLANRSNQTALLREDGDSKLRIATREGRRTMVEDVREELPYLLTDKHCKGAVRFFLGHFPQVAVAPEGLTQLLRCKGVARARTAVQDPTTFNLRHDFFTSVCSRLATQWVREIARTFAVAATQAVPPRQIVYDQVTRDLDEGVTNWVASPDVARTLQDRTWSYAFPVEGAPTVGLLGPVGALVIDQSSFQCAGREFHDRWEVAASFEYTLWANWSKVRTLEVLGMPLEAMVV